MSPAMRLKLDGVTQRQGPNYREMVAQFTVSQDGSALSRDDAVEAQLSPPAASTTTEAALLTRGASQLYISLGDTAADGSIAVRIYHKPMVLSDLVRPGVDGVRRHAVAVGPAAAGRSAEAGRRHTRLAAGGVIA